MRWTKGKSPKEAPKNIPVLGVYFPNEWRKKSRHEVLIRVSDNVTWYGGTDPVTTQEWRTTGGISVDTPDRFWELPC